MYSNVRHVVEFDLVGGGSEERGRSPLSLNMVHRWA